MKLWCTVLSAVFLTASLSAQQPAPRRAGLAAYLQVAYAGIKANLIAAAEAMPEADYGLRPGSMPDVRTFADVVMHVADSHYDTCARLKGVPDPVQQRGAPTAKADIVRALADSFAFCDDVVASFTDDNALDWVRQGPYELTRASVLYGMLAHYAEMYGVSTVYLRLKGLVPPSTARQNSGAANVD